MYDPWPYSFISASKRKQDCWVWSWIPWHLRLNCLRLHKGFSGFCTFTHCLSIARLHLLQVFLVALLDKAPVPWELWDHPLRRCVSLWPGFLYAVFRTWLCVVWFCMVTHGSQRKNKTEQPKAFLFKYLYLPIFLPWVWRSVCIHVHACVTVLLRHACGRQRPTCRSRLHPSTMEILRI